MKYFSYKRLNKRRKFYFWLFLIGGIIEFLSGIFTKDLLMVSLGLIFLAECLDLYNDQVSSDLIDSYANMVETMHDAFETTIKTISETIKRNDTEKLQKFSETFDSWKFEHKEEENDSNEG